MTEIQNAQCKRAWEIYAAMKAANPTQPHADRLKIAFQSASTEIHGVDHHPTVKPKPKTDIYKGLHTKADASVTEYRDNLIQWTDTVMQELKTLTEQTARYERTLKKGKALLEEMKRVGVDLFYQQ